MINYAHTSQGEQVHCDNVTDGAMNASRALIDVNFSFFMVFGNSNRR